jgi:hypothetical protein
MDFVQSEYKFPPVLYDVDNEFINHAVKTYEETTSNLGILLCGVRGTGKSVTAKQFCNRFVKSMPVVIITQAFSGIDLFFNDIQQDIAIFVDEYEKVFTQNQGNDGKLLTLMDGAISNGHRRIFILTANDMHVNQNLLQRPGRIRYIRKYPDTPLNTVKTIIEDKLLNKEHREDALTFISGMEIITIDIMCSLIEEANIHCKPVSSFAKFFNIKTRDMLSRITKISDPSAKPINALEPYHQYAYTDIGSSFYVNKVYCGCIVDVDPVENIVETQFCDGDVEYVKGKTDKYRIESYCKQHPYFM